MYLQNGDKFLGPENQWHCDERGKQQFPCFYENISKQLQVKRHPGANSNELTNLNLVKIEEEKKATREKFKGIKHVLDQVIHWDREMALSITVKKNKLREVELISAEISEYIQQPLKENKIKRLNLM